MKTTGNIFRVFLDTSALLSGLNSPIGGAGIILALFTLQEIEISISPEVVMEAKRNILTKFSRLETAFLAFLIGNPIVTEKITHKELHAAYHIIPSEDAPIAAGALKARAEAIITLDRRFQKLAQQNNFPLSILTPGEFLEQYRKKSLSFTSF